MKGENKRKKDEGLWEIPTVGGDEGEKETVSEVRWGGEVKRDSAVSNGGEKRMEGEK